MASNAEFVLPLACQSGAASLQAVAGSSVMAVVQRAESAVGGDPSLREVRPAYDSVQPGQPGRMVTENRALMVAAVLNLSCADRHLPHRVDSPFVGEVRDIQHFNRPVPTDLQDAPLSRVQVGTEDYPAGFGASLGPIGHPEITVRFGEAAGPGMMHEVVDRVQKPPLSADRAGRESPPAEALMSDISKLLGADRAGSERMAFYAGESVGHGSGQTTRHQQLLSQAVPISGGYFDGSQSQFFEQRFVERWKFSRGFDGRPTPCLPPIPAGGLYPSGPDFDGALLPKDRFFVQVWPAFAAPGEALQVNTAVLHEDGRLRYSFQVVRRCVTQPFEWHYEGSDSPIAQGLYSTLSSLVLAQPDRKYGPVAGAEIVDLFERLFFGKPVQHSPAVAAVEKFRSAVAARLSITPQSPWAGEIAAVRGRLSQVLPADALKEIHSMLEDPSPQDLDRLLMMLEELGPRFKTLVLMQPCLSRNGRFVLHGGDFGNQIKPLIYWRSVTEPLGFPVRWALGQEGPVPRFGLADCLLNYLYTGDRGEDGSPKDDRTLEGSWKFGFVHKENWVSPEMGAAMVEFLSRILDDIEASGGRWAMRCSSWASRQEAPDLAARVRAASLAESMEEFIAAACEWFREPVPGWEAALSPESKRGIVPSTQNGGPHAVHMFRSSPQVASLVVADLVLLQDGARELALNRSPGRDEFTPQPVGVFIRDAETVEDPEWRLPREFWSAEEVAATAARQEVLRAAGSSQAEIEAVGPFYPDLLEDAKLAQEKQVQRRSCPDSQVTAWFAPGGLPLVMPRYPAGHSQRGPLDEWVDDHSLAALNAHPQVLWAFVSHDLPVPRVTRHPRHTVSASVQAMERLGIFAPLLNQALLHSRLRAKITVAPAAVFDPQERFDRGAPDRYSLGFNHQVPTELSHLLFPGAGVPAAIQSAGIGQPDRSIHFPPQIADQQDDSVEDMRAFIFASWASHMELDNYVKGFYQ